MGGTGHHLRPLQPQEQGRLWFWYHCKCCPKLHLCKYSQPFRHGQQPASPATYQGTAHPRPTLNNLSECTYKVTSLVAKVSRTSSFSSTWLQGADPCHWRVLQNTVLLKKNPSQLQQSPSVAGMSHTDCQRPNLDQLRVALPRQVKGREFLD